MEDWKFREGKEAFMLCRKSEMQWEGWPEQCVRTHAGIPQQCLGWMNKRGAAPGDKREREWGEEKRVIRAKAGLSRG